MDKDLTILTYPVNLYGNLKYLYRQIILRRGIYGGHNAVTRSLIQGLNKINFIKYNYQPFFEKDVSQNHVHVLAGIDTLKYAIKLKKQNRIKKLTVGPNVFSFDSKIDPLIYDTNIDKYFQPTKYLIDIYKKKLVYFEPNKFDFFPSGVDVDYFKPNITLNDKININNKNILIYYKYESQQILDITCKIVKNSGYNFKIITYSKYDLNEYKNCLNNCLASIFISRQETQGIALQEAWSMDVPTIVYDPGYWYFKDFDYMCYYKKNRCPLLNNKTGIVWYNFENLNNIILNLNKIINGFNPRFYCVKNFSDEACAKFFLKKCLYYENK